MTKLYYGSGYCNIEGHNEVRGVQIAYRGAVKITNANENFHIAANDKMIIIFPLGEGFLTELFTYKGELKITSVIVSDNGGERIPTTVKRVMDYSELMDTNAEDLTTNSERLNAGYKYRGKVRKTIVIDNIIKNQYSDNELYLRNGDAYTGAYHVHPNGRAMTGDEHTKDSKHLYFKTTSYGRSRGYKPGFQPERLPIQCYDCSQHDGDWTSCLNIGMAFGCDWSLESQTCYCGNWMENAPCCGESDARKNKTKNRM